MEQKLTIAEQIFGLVEKMTGFLDKFGIIKLFKTIFSVVVMYWLIILCFNPSKIFEAYETWKDKIHSEKVAETLEKQLLIQNSIVELKYKTDAMRTLCCVLHNGNESINGTYQFIKISALFEECGDYQPVIDEYQSLHISQYPIFTHLAQKQSFCGNIEKLKDIDNKMYHRLIANGVGYVHIQSLFGEKGDIIGFLVLTWESEPENHNKIHNLIYSTGLKISRLL